MKKYEKQVLKSQMDSEDKTLKELRQIFTKSKQDVKEKIAQLNARTDTENLQSIIYQRQYQEMILGQIESTLDELNSGQYKTVDSFLHDSYEEGYLGTMYSLQQQGVPMVMPINDKKVYEALVTNTKLSKKYYGSNPLKGRLQENVDLLKTRIRTNLSRGIASGMSWVQVASNIASGMNNPFDVAMRDSMRIVRTEGRRVNEKASLDVALEARDKGADLVKIWDATLDGRTRPWHREADGQIRELDDDFLVMGEHLKAPLQGGSARNVINCRCFAKHTPRWALDGGSTKYDGFTDQLLTFDSPDDYAKFKELYWSEDNVAYMKYVSQLEDKYGTKDTKKLLSLMSDREYQRYKTLENNSPFWNGQIDDFFNNDKMKTEQSIPNPFGFNITNGEHTLSDDVAKVNPLYSTGKLYQNNCGYCSVGYELRRRGFDVEANPKNGLYVTEWKKMFSGFKPQNVSARRKTKAVEEMKQEISSWGEGARGGVFVVWDGRSWGHFFDVEVVNGEAVFVDGQNGKSGQYVEDYFKRVKPSSIIYGRWDNLEPSEKIKEAVKNKGLI